MKLKVNGEQQEIENKDCYSLAKLIADKGLNFKNIVIEYNREIIPKNKWEQVALKEDDSIEIISFVGGG